MRDEMFCADLPDEDDEWDEPTSEWYAADAPDEYGCDCPQDFQDYQDFRNFQKSELPQDNEF